VESHNELTADEATKLIEHQKSLALEGLGEGE